jgi:ankyrin repeat protein
VLRAAADGQREDLKSLIESGECIDDPDEEGWTALMHAADTGHKEVVQWLLTTVRTYPRKNGDGAMPLSRAAAGGYVDYSQAASGPWRGT